MRRKLFVMALLGTTALTPAPAQAGGVALFFQGVIASFGASATTAAVATALGGAAQAGFAVGSFLTGSFLGKTLLSLGISAVAQSLYSPPSLPEPSARMVNTAQPVSYAQTCYGECRPGGFFGMWESGIVGNDVVTGQRGNMTHYTVVLAAHPVDGVVQHRLGERVAEVDADGTVTTDPMAGYGRIRFYDGSPGQAADAELVDKVDWMTPAHDYDGLTYAAIWARSAPQSKLSEIYPTSREWAYLPVIRGKSNIYDPRDGQYKYTDNFALCYADFIVNDFGLSVDWDEVAQEADACDVGVVNAQGAIQPRWTCNGYYDDSIPRDQKQSQFMGAANLFTYERPDGSHGFKVGRWIAPTVTLGPRDFLSLTRDDGRLDIKSPTALTPKYVEPENGYRETPSGTIVLSESGPEQREEPRLYFVDNHNQAIRAATQMGAAQRAERRITGVIGFRGYDLMGQRFFTLDHPELGTAEDYEVLKLQKVGPGQFEIEAALTSADVFRDDVTEPARPEFKPPELYAPGNAPLDVPTGLTVEAPGDGRRVLEVNWDAQPEEYSQTIEYRRIVSGVAEAWVSAGKVSRGSTTHTIFGLVDGAEYDVRLFNVTGRFGNRRESAPAGPIRRTVLANATPPDALSNFAVTDDGVSEATLTATAANDPKHAGVVFFEGATFAGASEIATVYGAASAQVQHVKALVSGQTYTFWAAPINSSGQVGAESGPETVTISTS